MKITVLNGIAREKNPHYLFENQSEEDEENLHEAKSNLWHRKFEESVQSYPCFDNTGKVVDSYEGEAELVWQIRVNRDLVEAGIDREIRWEKAYPPLAKELSQTNPEAFRQVYIIQPTAIQKVHSLISGSRSVKANPINSTKGKIDTSIVYGPGDDNYGRDKKPPAEPFGREPVSYDTANYSEITAESKEPAKVGEGIEETRLSVLRTSLNTTLFSAHLNGKKNPEQSYFEWEKNNDVVTNLIGLIKEILG